jgi:radical SAM superfamily enzyme YgiQ (UPF0313 family)
MVKITFIKPNLSELQSRDAMQPLAFAILAALTPKNVEIELFDEKIEKIPLDLKTDLIAMGVETFTAKRAYNLSKIFRARGIPVLMGGCHPTLMPEEAMQNCDSIVIGEPERIWPQIVEDLLNSKLKKIYKDSKPVDITNLNYDRTIFRSKKYLPVLPVQFSRGCNKDCDFCCVKSLLGKGMRYRAVDKVVEDIKASKGEYFFFVDDNLFSNKNKLIELLKKLIPLKIKWSCQVSIDAGQDDNLLRLMKKSGCISVFIGLESLSIKNLEYMDKYTNINFKNYEEIIKKIKSHNILVYATFVLGYDADTKKVFKEVADFAIKNKLFLTNFNLLMPFPKTRLYDRLKSEGRLIYDNWWIDDSYRYGNSFFKPKNMTPNELAKGCYDARIKFNSLKSLIYRAFDFKSNTRNLKMFLMSNYISRKEILKKQGIKLG